MNKLLQSESLLKKHYNQVYGWMSFYSFHLNTVQPSCRINHLQMNVASQLQEGKNDLYNKVLFVNIRLCIRYHLCIQKIAKRCPALQICSQHEPLILTCEHCKEPRDRVELKGTERKKECSLLHKSRFYMSNNVINMNKQHGPFYNSQQNTSAIVQLIRGNLYLQFRPLLHSPL